MKTWLILLSICMAAGARAQNPQTITVNIGHVNAADSVVKPHMLGVIAGPSANYQSTAPDLTSHFQDVGITTIRNNDYYDDRLDMERMFFCGSYPVNQFTPQYPDWDCDPADTANYHFSESDLQFENWLDGGFLPFFRVGGELAHAIRPHDYKGPRNNEEANWIQAAIHVVNRYNNFDGGANTLGGYLNIWTEYPHKVFWDRDSLSFNNFWCNTYDSLKNHFPALKIGGPGFNTSVSTQIGNTVSGNINTHADLFLRELEQRNIKPSWIGFHVFSNDIAVFYNTSIAFRKLLRAEAPFAAYNSVWGNANGNFFDGVELICDAWGFDNDQSLTESVRDSLFNRKWGAAHHTGVFIAFQQADVERAYIYRGTELGYDPNHPGLMGLFIADSTGTYKPVSYGFKMCSKMQTIYHRKLTSPAFDVASGGSKIWTLAGESAGGGKALLVSNPSADTVLLTLTVDGNVLSSSVFSSVNHYFISDTDNGETPHAWTGGSFTLLPGTSNLITMENTTAIDEFSAERKNIFLHPNPAGDRVTLTSDKQISSVEFYTIQGQCFKIIPALGNTQLISISDLPRGLFLIKANFKDGSHWVGKMIKE